MSHCVVEGTGNEVELKKIEGKVHYLQLSIIVQPILHHQEVKLKIKILYLIWLIGFF